MSKVLITAFCALLFSFGVARGNELDVQIGVASWYGAHWHGRLTASGTRFDERELTAASRTLPLGTVVLVASPTTRKHLILTITDRGPYVGDRIIDLSERCAEELGIRERGLAPVKVIVLYQSK